MIGDTNTYLSVSPVPGAARGRDVVAHQSSAPHCIYTLLVDLLPSTFKLPQWAVLCLAAGDLF